MAVKMSKTSKLFSEIALSNATPGMNNSANAIDTRRPTHKSPVSSISRMPLARFRLPSSFMSASNV